MRCELPVLRRCCCCVPLRIGLLVWAYFKLIASLLILTFTTITFFNHKRNVRVDDVSVTIYALMMILMILDIVFHAFFIASAHKKEYRKMRVFYRYCIVVLCLNLLVFLMFSGMMAYSTYLIYISRYRSLALKVIWYMMPDLAGFLILLCIQGYLIILVRSEFVKLKNNSQFEFVNNAAGENCTAKLDFVEEIPITV